jgi:deferrochelatase/peroxidase EfeB
MNARYLMLIEQLVREGRSENEIEAIVGRTVDEDAEVLEDGPNELPAAA